MRSFSEPSTAMAQFSGIDDDYPHMPSQQYNGRQQGETEATASAEHVEYATDPRQATTPTKGFMTAAEYFSKIHVPEPNEEAFPCDELEAFCSANGMTSMGFMSNMKTGIGVFLAIRTDYLGHLARENQRLWVEAVGQTMMLGGDYGEGDEPRAREVIATFCQPNEMVAMSVRPDAPWFPGPCFLVFEKRRWDWAMQSAGGREKWIAAVGELLVEAAWNGRLDRSWKNWRERFCYEAKALEQLRYVCSDIAPPARTRTRIGRGGPW